MAKKTAFILGLAFMLLGIVGFFVPHVLDTHLSPMHNIIHFISGAAAVYYSVSNTVFARRFCLIFGTFYFLLGVLGFALGKPSAPTVPITAPQLHEDAHLWQVLPGTLELGDHDHALHLVLGLVFVFAGLMPASKAVVPRLRTAPPDERRKEAV